TSTSSTRTPPSARSRASNAAPAPCSPPPTPRAPDQRRRRIPAPDPDDPAHRPPAPHPPKEPDMPLVRITQHDVRTPAQSRQLADIVQDVMLELFDAPPGDRYQIIETLPVGSILAEDTGLGIERSDGVVIIHVTQQGRSTAQKQAIYSALAERLAAADLVRPEDLIVSVVHNDREDWSFGLGRAQFLTGEL